MNSPTEIKQLKQCLSCKKKYPVNSRITCCPRDNFSSAPFEVLKFSTRPVPEVDSRYSILYQINAGGWGEIYLAEHVFLKRKVAIKLLHSSFASSPDRLLRFKQEADAACKLKHPNIVTIHDYGLTADARPYIVMDYVQGQTIEQVVRGRPMEPAFATRRAIEIVSALALSHKHGIVHRDIKASNIMLTKIEKGEGEARLLDFGLAKVMNEIDSPGLTKTGEVLGTPRYMSPEQCRGLPLDGRSDQYSLGCVLYEMLAGKPLVECESVLDCMNWHMSGTMPPLPSKSRMTTHLQVVLKRMLSKDPDHRYKDMFALKRELQNVLHGVPPSSAASPSAKSNRTLKPLAVVASVVASLACLSFGMFWYFNSVHTPIARPAAPIASVPTTPDSPPEQLLESPTRSAREFRHQLSTINAAIAKLRARKDWRSADAMDHSLTYYLRNLLGTFNPPTVNQTKLMLLGVYEGDSSRSATGSGVVDTYISYKHGPIALALNSYGPVTWRLKVEPGVKIDKIIVSGHSPSNVENPPPGVLVENRSEHGASYLPLWSDSPAPEDAVQPIASEIYGMKYTTCTGVYNPSKSATLEVGPGSVDWRAQFILSEIQPLYTQAANVIRGEINPTLKSMRFWELADSEEGNGAMTADSFETAVNTRPVSIFQSNGLGPMRSTSMAPPIDELIKVTDAGKHGPLYGMTLNAIYKFSTKPVRPASLLCEPSRVPLTVLSSITYDTNRQRIIAWGTTEEAPAICAYSTRTHTWSTLRRLTHRDIRLADIVYDPKKDRLFGLAATMEDSQPSYSKVLEMTPNGQVLKSITLSSPTEGGVWQNHVALHVKDDLLVIFSPQIYDPNDSRLPVPAKVYVYQLSSGRLIWKGRREPQ